MKKFKEYLEESSLSRLWIKNEKHDCGSTTASRLYDNCGYKDKENKVPCPNESDPQSMTKKEKQKRNVALASDLLRSGFKITKIKGKYTEGGDLIKEYSYFISDDDDKGNLKEVLIKIGEKYDQDSVLFVPKGTVLGKNKAILIGTNKCCNNWVKYHEEKPLTKARFGYENPEYTSYINGRPFVFEDVSISQPFESKTEAMLAHSFSLEYEK